MFDKDDLELPRNKGLDLKENGMIARHMAIDTTYRLKLILLTRL